MSQAQPKDPRFALQARVIAIGTLVGAPSEHTHFWGHPQITLLLCYPGRATHAADLPLAPRLRGRSSSFLLHTEEKQGGIFCLAALDHGKAGGQSLLLRKVCTTSPDLTGYIRVWKTLAFCWELCREIQVDLQRAAALPMRSSSISAPRLGDGGSW